MPWGARDKMLPATDDNRTMDPVSETDQTDSEPGSDQTDLEAKTDTPDPSAADHERAAEAYETEDENVAEYETPLTNPEEDEDADTWSHTLADEADSESEPEEDEDLDWVSLKGKRILLIEDDEEFAEGISGYLKELGIAEVLLAKNAEAGLSYLADKDSFPHLVLLELALIGMDGIQFLAQLRASKHKRLQNLPAVVITMLDSPSIYRRAANQKVGAFLRKPVAISALKDGLQGALRGDIVEKPFSQPKSWLDEVDEQELKAKREANIAKAAAKAQKQGFLVRLLSSLIPWSGKA